MFPLRRILVIPLTIGWCLLMAPIQMVLLRLHQPAAKQFPKFFFAGLCRLLRMQIEVRGEICTNGPVLYASNHISWIDIPVLGKLLDASFIAKHDVEKWPLVGFLARCGRTVFIERRARRTADHRDEMLARLQAGDSLILFPEGTSADGIRLLPYKSAFFSLAEQRVGDRPLTVQPISIAFTQLNNLPVGRRTTGLYAWMGDEDLGPHVWRYLGAGPGKVVVTFHQSVAISQFASRKELSEYCRLVTSQGIDEAKTGRPRLAPALALSGTAAAS